MEPFSEVHEISDEDLEAAADMYDKLVAGTFYEEQEKSVREIRQIKTREEVFT